MKRTVRVLLRGSFAEISGVDRPACDVATVDHVMLAKRSTTDMDLNPEALKAAGIEENDIGPIKKFFGWLFEKKTETAANINDLPDSDFAYIEPGGEKDDSGKTTPRSKRHLPIHDAAHVRNALARLDQTDIPAAAKKTALGRIKARAKKFDVEVSEDKAEKAARIEFRKSLYDVGDLASLIQRLDYMVSCASAERQYEGDESEMPEKLAAARDELGKLLLEMAQEELEEMKPAA